METTPQVRPVKPFQKKERRKGVVGKGSPTHKE